MTTENIIKDLDAALTEQAEPSFAEQYPEAPQWAVEMAADIEAREKRLDQNAERLERAEQTRKARAALEKKSVENAVTDLKTKTAALAAGAGVATKEETQRLKEAAADDQADDLDGLANRLSTSNTADTHAHQ